MRPRPLRFALPVALAALAASALPTLAASAPPAGIHVAAFSAQSRVTVGARVHVSGRVAPAAPVRVLIQRSRPDGTWTLAATLRAGADGRFDGMVPLAGTASLRAAVRTADGSVLPGRRRFVAVSRALVLAVRPPIYQEIAGVPFAVEGAVRPARPGERVTIEGSRGGTFRPLRTVAVRRGGSFRGRVAVPAAGTWRFRVRAEATESGQSSAEVTTLPILVFGRNPHGIPRSAPHFIVQERGQMRLYYYENGTLLRVFPVVFGAPGTPTPIGRFRVYSKTTGPRAAFGPLVLWYHRGYGIHGTNQEYLLGRTWRYYSHGCTRNYNDNIRWLWPRVPVGTPVVNLA